MKLLRTICLIFLFFPALCTAQSAYQPLADSKRFCQKVQQKMQKRLSKDLAKVEGKHQKEIKEAYNKRFERLSTQIDNNHFISDPSFNTYFNSILDKILAVNPVLQKRDIRLLVSRYPWPNASCHGEGTIVLNLGLISRLQNESQLAFVLCHELAHDYQNHVNNAIHDHVHKLNSKTTKRKLKKIAKSEYNTYEKANELLNSLTFDMRRHSRLHETEADSLALNFLRATSYDPHEGVNALAILDEIDQPKRPQVIDFKKHFDSEDFYIRDRWLKVKEGGLLAVVDEEDLELRDSLKTHPDCQKRIKAAERILSGTEKRPFPDSIYLDYIRLADYEIIEASYGFQQYGRALYHAFLLVEEYPEDAYLHSMIMHCLYELHRHQQNHELGKVLDLPDRRFDKNYNELLHFIHNLRLRDLAKLGFYYGLKHQDQFMNEEVFRVAHLFCAALVEDKAKWKDRKITYLKDFPSGKLRREVRNFEPGY